MTRNQLPRPMLLAAASFTAASGYVHLREWLDVYRAVPRSVPGAWVVRIGFPANAAASTLAAIALVLAATRLPKLKTGAMLGAALLALASLIFLVGSRTGTVLGWREPAWTPAAKQSLALELAAVAVLAVATMLRRACRTAPAAVAR